VRGQSQAWRGRGTGEMEGEDGAAWNLVTRGSPPTPEGLFGVWWATKVGVVLTIVHYACDVPWVRSVAQGVPWALARKGAFYDVLRRSLQIRYT
jgi:hypothetical protein